MAALKNLSAQSLATAAVVAAAAGMIASAGLGLFALHEAMDNSGLEGARKMAQAAAGIVMHYESAEASGAVPLGEAQRLATEAVAAMRFDPHGYLWINSADQFVYHPQAALVGRGNATDCEGKDILTILNAVAFGPSGEGPASYSWPLPSGEGCHAKESYVVSTPRWKWVVGTGLYRIDANSAFATEGKAAGGWLAAILMAFLTLCAAASRALAAKVPEPIAGPRKRFPPRCPDCPRGRH